MAAVPIYYHAASSTNPTSSAISLANSTLHLLCSATSSVSWRRTTSPATPTVTTPMRPIHSKYSSPCSVFEDHPMPLLLWHHFEGAHSNSWPSLSIIYLQLLIVVFFVFLGTMGDVRVPFYIGIMITMTGSWNLPRPWCCYSIFVRAFTPTNKPASKKFDCNKWLLCVCFVFGHHGGCLLLFLFQQSCMLQRRGADFPAKIPAK